MADRVTVENVNHPGRTSTLDAGPYKAMRVAMLAVLPSRAPGLTQAEMLDALQPHLPEALFPGGEKAGWWAKSVQLDLEAKGVIVRERTSPLRWHRMADPVVPLFRAASRISPLERKSPSRGLDRIDR